MLVFAGESRRLRTLEFRETWFVILILLLIPPLRGD